MDIKNQQGWISVKFILISILILMCISYTFTFYLQLNQEMSTDKICRTEQQKIMSQVRSGIEFIFSFNDLAENLYTLQKALEPFIWVPKIAILYKKILSFRKKMDFLQNRLIQTYNLQLQIQALQLYLKLNRHFSTLKKDYRFYYRLTSIMYPPKRFKMAIKKKMKIIFSPYVIEKDFVNKQQLKIDFFNQFNANSKDFIFTSFQQIKTCATSLNSDQYQHLEIKYLKKTNAIDSW